MAPGASGGTGNSVPSSPGVSPETSSEIVDGPEGPLPMFLTTAVIVRLSTEVGLIGACVSDSTIRSGCVVPKVTEVASVKVGADASSAVPAAGVVRRRSSKTAMPEGPVTRVSVPTTVPPPIGCSVTAIPAAGLPLASSARTEG